MGIGPRGRTVEASVKRRLDAGQRRVTAQQRNGLEDARRDGRAGDRDAERLEHLLGLEPALLEQAAQGRLHALGVPRGGQGREPLGRQHQALARLRIAEELLARLGIVDRAVEEEARHRPELVERRHLLLADRGGVAQAAAAGHGLEAGREVVEAELAHVAAVHVAQLLLVEDRRRLGHALDAEALLELLGGHELGLLVVAPAQQRHVVADRLGQVALVAQLLHRRRPVALGELLAVGAVQQRHVGVDRSLLPERLEDQELLGRVGIVIRAADDMGDARVEIVHDDREVVHRRSVGPSDHEVVHEAVLEVALAANQVVYPRRALVRDAQAHRSGALVLAPEALVAAVALLEGVDLFAACRGAVGVARVEKSLDDLGVPVGSLRLEDGIAVPVELEPLQRLEYLLDVLGRGALAVGVLDPQDERALSRAAGQKPVVQCRPRAADVQGAGWRRGEPHAHEWTQDANKRKRPDPMLIGAHVAPAGGPAKAVERGAERGCHSIQIFNQNPRQWAARDYSDAQVSEFHDAIEASDVDALLIHAVYLLNPASEDPDFREKTLASLTTSLRMGAALGARGVVLHPGSALKDGGEVGPALERAAEVIVEALSESEACPLHLEDTAGAGGTLGRTFEELARLVELAGGDERLGICLDSCHLYASGYDIAA